ncbi:MAG: hypothetical protein K5886_03155 [Lachnospiraceae bacterium]|nr:hypothetical protein [Lachnospiraceae bacterium]
MLNTYERYLDHPAGHVLKIEDAMDIYGRMVESFGQCKLEDKRELWDGLLERAAEYTYIRNKWELMSREERIEADEGRTIKHNSFIRELDIIARAAELCNIDNSWRKDLGDDRKRIGDFACFIAYITGISNR